MNKRILILTHYNFTDVGPIHGPANSIEEYLINKKVNFEYIEHPLYAGNTSHIKVYKRGSLEHERDFGWESKSNMLLKSILEMVFTLFSARGKYKTVIAIDPLNCFTTIVMKLLNKTKKIIYYTVDYADKRFRNLLLNSIYHGLDKYCLKKVDEVWSVSSRIREKRKRQGVSEDRNILIPNSPIFKKENICEFSEINKNKIIMISGITHAGTFKNLLKSIKKLKKIFPKIVLEIAGTGSYEKRLKEQIRKMGLSKNVKVLGQLEHKNLMDSMRDSYLGVALYTKKYSWTEYGDSMKIREYLSCGIPVITTNVVSTSDDVEKCKMGIVIDDSSKLYEAMYKIMNDSKLFREMRKNAIKYSSRLSLTKLLEKNLKI